MKLSRNKLALAISVLSGAALYAPVYTSAAGLVLEEIVVTAQKRAENLSDTPLSIQAISGDDMESQNILEVQDMADLVPNLMFSNSSGPSYATIRGLGTGPTNSAAEQSVGMYIDGIYVSRGYQFNAPFLDVERVEVLKGPQGVLQGKNSVAGAIVIHTRRPTEETEGYVRGSYDIETESYVVEGAVSGALADNVYARLTAMHNDEGGWLDTNSRLSSDGLTQLQGEDDQNTNEVDVLRLSMAWDATDSLSLFGKLESSNRRTEGVHFGPSAIEPGEVGDTLLADFTSRDPNFGFIQDGTISSSYALDYDADTNTFVTSDRDQYIDIEAQSASLQFDWDLGLGTLTGISGYSTYEVEEALQQAMAPIDWLFFVADRGDGGDELDQFTQEFRLTSPGDETFDYVVGLYYMDRTIERAGYQQNIALTSQDFPAFADTVNVKQFKEETTAWSAFGQVTWNINENLRANFGGRYTDESKDKPNNSSQNLFLLDAPALNQIILDAFGAVPFTNADVDVRTVDDTSFDPSISLQWDVAEDTMLYASYSTATKAGGFNSNATNLDDAVFDPETAESFEMGVKSFLMDGRLNINAAIFYSEFDDLQVSALDPNTNSLTFQNAAKANSQGLEADFRFAATESLELGGALGYLDATYDDYPGASCSAGISIEADCDAETSTRNAKGDSLRTAPEWSGNLYADYRWNLHNGMEIGLRADLIYSDEYFITAQNDPFGVQDSYTKVNLLAELRSADNGWVLSVVGKNLTDESTASFGGATAINTGAYWSNASKPRQVFFNAQYNF